MSREQSDGEDSVGETGTDGFVDVTVEMEVELRLPLEVDMKPDRIREDVLLFPEIVDPDAVNTNQGTQHGFGFLNVAKPKWSRHGLSLPLIPELRRQLPGAGAQPVGSGDGRCKLDTFDPTYPGLIQRQTSTWIRQPKPTPHRFTLGSPTPAFRSPDRPFPGVGTQLEFNRFKDGVPNMTGPDLRNGLPGLSDRSDLSRAPETVLMDTVVRLQLEVAAMKAGTPNHQTIGGPTSLVQHRLVVFISTKVARFAGVTSWKQYCIRCYCAVKWVG